MSSSQQNAKFSEPQYAQSERKATDYPWYLPNIDKYLCPQTQELLVEYSHIPRDQQSEHVHRIRDRAWKIRSYPCTGIGAWLVPYIAQSPSYWAILERLKAGEIFLDVGCFLGMDMRKMVYDGAPSSNMYGVDIVNHWNVGFDLFQDKNRFNAKFIEADILSDIPALKSLYGTINIISISAVLHQWDWDDQVKAAKRLVDFSMPGTLVVGHQIGNKKGHQIQNKVLQALQWRHDPTSFEKLWDQVGRETDTVWVTKAALHTYEDVGWHSEDMKWLEPDDQVLDFVVTREQ